ncbi:MAG: multiheme c-type cytochrome, partial [Aeoliella sp.]
MSRDILQPITKITQYGLLLAIACLVVVPLTLWAQEGGNQAEFVCPTLHEKQDATPLAMGRRLVGTLGCERCHLLGQGELTEFSRSLLDDPWVLNNEYATWRNSDRHAQAYATLLGKRSKRMGSLLGVADVSRDARCLACHATVPVEWMTDDKMMANPATVGAILDGPGSALVTNGISCEACHGAAGNGTGPNETPKGWNGPHKPEGLITEAFKSTWRFNSIADKQATNGFYDVRSPASRTRMCVSCHVGDPERGRLVTHEMYAAGHPPLPAFEVETFMRDMPPHWRVLGTSEAPVDSRPDTLHQKPANVTREFLERTNDSYFAKLRTDKPALFNAITDNFHTSFDRTRSLAVGAIVTWAQSSRVTAALASEESHPLIPSAGRWPELAVFE